VRQINIISYKYNRFSLREEERRMGEKDSMVSDLGL